MIPLRIAYQFHHFSNIAKKKAERQNKGKLLTQFLYDEDGSLFEISGTVHAYKRK